MVNVPIVTLDKIYIKPDEEDILFIDCTRVNGMDTLLSRKKEPINKQIDDICKRLNKNKIILSDDVIFSGAALRNIIREFNSRGVEVVEIIASICTRNSYEYFNRNLKYGVKCNYLLSEDVIDQICERDFYFGIAGSGILVNKDKEIYKSPYFKPFGNPNERASIPKELEDFFSKGCLERSLILWEEIDRLKKRQTYIRELPEKIINTNQEESVVKTLRKELRK